jgi:hypothetical protein
MNSLLLLLLDEIYSNAIPVNRPRKRPFRFKPSPFAPSSSQQKKRKPSYAPYRNVRINNSFGPFHPKNWSAYTQVIFHPERSEVIDITLGPSNWPFAESNTIEKIANTSSSSKPLSGKLLIIFLKTK